MRIPGKSSPAGSSPATTETVAPRATLNPAQTIAAPPRRRRSLWALILGGLFVILGTLLMVWVFQSRGGGEAVLAMRADVPRGHLVQAEDLVEARISTDPAVRGVPVADRDSIIGQRALVDLSAGGLVTPGAVGEVLVPQEGMSVVGVSLSPAMRPGMDLAYGDQVRIVFTPGPQETTDQVPDPIPAVVVEVGGSEAASVGTDAVVVDVQVRADQAAALAARAAAGQISLVLDAREG